MPPVERKALDRTARKSNTVAGFLGGFCTAPLSFCKQPVKSTKGQHSKKYNFIGFLDEEYERLPAEEKEKIIGEIYGEEFDEHAVEEPGFVDDKLNQFEIALQSLRAKEAYELALRECSEEVNDASFRLNFLRAENFVPKKAARRFVKYWKYKLELWGPEKAFKGKIDVDDFDEEDRISLSTGSFRLLNATDKAGRGIIWSRFQDREYKSSQNLLRSVWYVMSKTTESEMFLRKGLVGLGFCLGSMPLMNFDRNVSKNFTCLLSDVFPIRMLAYHQCIDDMKFQTIIPTFLFYLSKLQRGRYILHKGTALECLFEVSSYGIPVDALPVDLEGNVEYESHLRWIEKERRFREDSMSTPDTSYREISD